MLFRGAPAVLLQKAGHEVHGVYLDNAEESARLDAVSAAERMGIALTVIDVKRELEENVCRPFTEAYLRGETPELGIWYDAESTRMTAGDVTETCMTFLNRLTDYGHQYEGIYASWNWLSKDGAHYIDVDALPDYVPLWVAQYNSHDDLSGEYPGRVRIWQYSDHFSDELPYDADEYYEE